MNLAELGTVLKERREAIGLTRAELARRIGVSRSYVSAIESAQPRVSGRPSQPSIRVIEAWAEALGWLRDDVDELMVFAGHQSNERKLRSPLSGARLRYPQPKLLERQKLHRSLDQALDGFEPGADWVSVTSMIGQFLSHLGNVGNQNEPPKSERLREASDLLHSFMNWLFFYRGLPHEER